MFDPSNAAVIIHDDNGVQIDVLHQDFLARISPLSPGQSLFPWANDHFSEIKNLLSKYGAVVIRDFDTGTEAFSQLADLFSPVSCKLQGQISPRTQIQGSVYTSTNFPPQYPIGQHHENCYDIAPPAYLFFYCRVAPTQGGETVLVDARKLFHKISPSVVKKFEEKGVKYVRNFTKESPYKTLQDTFLVDSPEALAAYCEKHGITCEQNGENFRASQVRGATVAHPLTGQKAFFNVAHIWHWSSIMEAAKAFGGDIAERIRQTPPDRQWGNALYGDGTEIEAEIVRDINALYQEEVRAVSWQRNDILIVDNVLATHGRRPFSGTREIQVTVRAPSAAPYIPAGGQPTSLWRELT